MKTLMRVSVVATAAMLMLAGCSNMTPRQQSTLSGGAIGAAAGAGVSALSGGDPVTGALVGGAAGAVIGNLKDQKK
ncbi:MAG: hypothetical protein K6346_08365 [Halothiobacillaceae bacterium]